MIGRLAFWVPGRPIGYKRTRRANSYGAYTPPANEAWRRDVQVAYQAAALAAAMTGGPEHTTRVEMALAFHGTDARGDLSNLLKEIEDALNKVAYDDDKRIRQVEMAFADGSDLQGVHITLTYRDTEAPILKRKKTRKAA